MGCTNSKDDSTSKLGKSSSVRQSPSASNKSSQENEQNSLAGASSPSKRLSEGFSDPISGLRTSSEDQMVFRDDTRDCSHGSPHGERDRCAPSESNQQKSFSLEILDAPPPISTPSSCNDGSIILEGSTSSRGVQSHARTSVSATRSVTSTTGTRPSESGEQVLSFIAPASGTSSILNRASSGGGYFSCADHSTMSGSRLSFPTGLNTPTSAAFRSNSIASTPEKSPSAEGGIGGPHSSLSALVFGGTILTSNVESKAEEPIVPPVDQTSQSGGSSSGEDSGRGIQRTKMSPDDQFSNPLDIPTSHHHKERSRSDPSVDDASISSENHLRFMALLETMETNINERGKAEGSSPRLGGSGTKFPHFQAGDASLSGEVIVSKLNPKHKKRDGRDNAVHLLSHPNPEDNQGEPIVLPQTSSINNKLTMQSLESHNLILKMQRNRQISIERENHRKKKGVKADVADFLGDDYWSGDEEDPESGDEGLDAFGERSYLQLHPDQQNLLKQLSVSDAELHRRIYEWVEWEE